MHFDHLIDDDYHHHHHRHQWHLYMGSRERARRVCFLNRNNHVRVKHDQTTVAVNVQIHRLAYAHENGIVLVDVIQKCIIMNATLCDLYGGASITSNNRDITIQPFATSSILQHHYQATTSSASSPSAGGMTGFSSDFANANHNKLTADNSTAGHHHQQTKVRSPSAKGAAGEQVGGDLVSHNEVSTSAMTSTDQTDSTLPGFNLKGVASNGGQVSCLNRFQAKHALLAFPLLLHRHQHHQHRHRHHHRHQLAC